MSIDKTQPSQQKPKVIRKVVRRHRETRRLKGSYCYVISPGNTECLKKAVINLQTVGEMNGRTDLEVTNVGAVVVPETRKVYLWPVDKDDPEGFKATVTQSWLRINLGPLLEEAKLALPVRHKERFQMVIVPEPETPDDVPNALCFDLNSPEEVQVLPRRSKKGKKVEKPEAPTPDSATGDSATGDD